MFEDDILVKENENWAMYTNSMTKMYQRELDSYETVLRKSTLSRKDEV